MEIQDKAQEVINICRSIERNIENLSGSLSLVQDYDDRVKLSNAFNDNIKNHDKMDEMLSEILIIFK